MSRLLCLIALCGCQESAGGLSSFPAPAQAAVTPARMPPEPQQRALEVWCDGTRVEGAMPETGSVALWQIVERCTRQAKSVEVVDARGMAIPIPRPEDTRWQLAHSRRGGTRVMFGEPPNEQPGGGKGGGKRRGRMQVIREPQKIVVVSAAR
jgi:hypothetical protein